jgi:hypothetical protein
MDGDVLFEIGSGGKLPATYLANVGLYPSVKSHVSNKVADLFDIKLKSITHNISSGDTSEKTLFAAVVAHINNPVYLPMKRSYHSPVLCKCRVSFCHARADASVESCTERRSLHRCGYNTFEDKQHVRKKNSERRSATQCDIGQEDNRAEGLTMKMVFHQCVF